MTEALTLAEARAAHDERTGEHRAAVAAHEQAKTATGALLDRAARGENITPDHLARAERDEQQAARVVALAEARLGASRLAAERAEIEALHHEADHLRATYGDAADDVIALGAKADAHLAALRADLTARDGAILRMQIAHNAARLFDHGGLDEKARTNTTLAALRPDQRPFVNLRVNATPERIAGAFYIDATLREPVPWTSLAARDANLLGRPVPEAKP